VTADLTITPGERTVSGALALIMHLLFLALLVFGVSWQKREPVAMVAELWSSLPPLPAPVAELPPKVEPAPPKPAPKAEMKPEPKPQPKADIDLREKKEKERKAKEQALAEKKKREEQALAEKKKREEQAREAEAKRAAQEQADALKKLAQQQATAQARLVDEYKRRIADKIRSRITEPLGLRENPEVEYDVVVLPGGEVLDVKIRKASGQVAWDSAVERAIRLAQPLPLPPPESGLMREFRELNLRFRPKE